MVILISNTKDFSTRIVTREKETYPNNEGIYSARGTITLNVYALNGRASQYMKQS